VYEVQCIIVYVDEVFNELKWIEIELIDGRGTPSKENKLGVNKKVNLIFEKKNR
jgi:hypothetical protein